jgi:hypothetical protein
MLEKSIQIDLATSTDAAEETPGTNAPRPPDFKDRPLTNIVEIRYRGYNEAGTVNDRDQALIVFETDPGLNVGDKLRLASVLQTLDLPSKTSTYTVESIGTATFGGQTYNTALYRPGRSSIVSGTITYNKGWRIRSQNVTLPADSLDLELDKYKYWQIKVYKGNTPSTNDDFLWGPTWPAGIATTSGVHMTNTPFTIGNLINIVGLGDPFDGTYKILNSSTSGTEITIKLEFKEYLSSVTLPTTNGAIRAAAGRYLRDGETWTDVSFTPPAVWIWDEEKQLWRNSSELPEDVVIDDGIAPSPPTSVTGTSEGYLSPSNQPYSLVELSWTAPTTNADSTNLSDLKGYKVYYRYSVNEDWVLGTDVAGTSATVQSLVPDVTVYFAVKAYDVSNNLSAFSQTYSISTIKGALTLGAPSAPVYTSKLGTVKVTWDGLDSTGSTPPAGYIDYIEVHYSTTSGFTPSSSTLKGTIQNATQFFNDITPAYDTNYYFKFIFVDAFGVKSTPSAQTLVTVQALVNTDLIEGSLTRWPFGANTIDVDSLADGSIAATYLVSGTDAGGNAVRTEGKIAAGSIGAVAIAANSIVAGKIAANAVTADKIEALAITAGKIAANAITADKIAAGAITAEKISAGAITGETITGGTITGAKLRTAATGERVEIGVSAFGAVSFFNSGGSQIGSIYAFSFDDGGGVNNWINIDSAYTYVSGYMAVSGAVNISGTLYTSGAISTGSTITSVGSITTDGGLTRTVYAGGGTTGASINNNGTIIRTTSSARYKQDISLLEFNYEDVLALEPKKFRLKDEVAGNTDARYYAGFIAEDIADTSLDIFVAYQKDENDVLRPDGVYYSELTSALLSAIKHQDSIIKDLTTRLEALESE